MDLNRTEPMYYSTVLIFLVPANKMQLFIHSITPGGTLYVGLDHCFEFQTFKFQIFLGFSEKRKY